MINYNYHINSYSQAMQNTKYNSEGKAVIEKDDDWRNETEWDSIYEQMKMERDKSECI